MPRACTRVAAAAMPPSGKVVAIRPSIWQENCAGIGADQKKKLRDGVVGEQMPLTQNPEKRFLATSPVAVAEMMAAKGASGVYDSLKQERRQVRHQHALQSRQGQGGCRGVPTALRGQGPPGVLHVHLDNSRKWVQCWGQSCSACQLLLARVP